MRSLSIVFPLENIHALAGMGRVMYALADLCKSLGHEVEVLGDRDGASPGPDDTVKVLRHYELEDIRDYYPLKSLASEDIDESLSLLSFHAWKRYVHADIVWSFSGIYDRLEDHCVRSDFNTSLEFVNVRNHWSYQHWPVTGDYPHPSCVLYSNSTYTQEAVKRRWGRDSRLLHPPLPLDRYDPSLGFQDRDIDIIYVGRVDPLKLGRPPVLERLKDLRTLIVGADNEVSFPDYKPNTEWIRNATIPQLIDCLRHTKVYVHWKGLLDRSGYEHMGITCLEAIASGTPIVVPKGGGPWLDISEQGKYCIGVSSVDEGIREATRLCTDKGYWEKYHNLAIEGVKRFGYDQAAVKLAKWLGAVK